MPSVWIDGSNVSGVAVAGSVTKRLNLPWMASVKIPMDSAIGGPGSRLKIALNGGLDFHGFILDCETDTGEDIGYTVYNAQDPWELWQWRPARDSTGDYSNPTFIDDNVTGPQIMEEILTQSEDDSAGDDVGVGEGPLFISFGGFETGGPDMTGAPVDWPMTIAEIAALLTSTGQVDIVLTPIDSGGNMAEVNCFNGDYGNDLTGSTLFQYGMGLRNISRLRVNEDMTNMCNKLRYLLGPRVGTRDDPGGVQHWEASVEGGTGPLEADPTGQINARMDASRAAYGVRSEIKIFDGRGDEGLAGRQLFMTLWQGEAWFRAVPRFMTHITPARGTSIGFGIGDLISVQASSAVRGGFSGAQRVYSFTQQWTDPDGPVECTELQTSPSQEGLP